MPAVSPLFSAGPAKPRIAIVGAGLGGLTLARMLHVKGLDASVFERDVSASERPYGGTLDMHADTGLFAIEQAGLLDAFGEVARYEDQGLRLFDKDANLLFEDSNGNRPEIDRGQLRELLRKSLPDGVVQWDHAVDAVQACEAGGAEIVFRNDTRQSFDLVVGADGAWSRVREVLSPARPAYTGLTFFEVEIKDVEARHPGIAELVSHGLLIASADRRTIFAQRNATGHVRVYVALRVDATGTADDDLHPVVAAKTRSDLVAHLG